MCRVQTRPELAEEDGRDLSGGSQQDQEHILRLGKFGLKNTWRTLAVTSVAGNSYGHAQHCSLPGRAHLWQSIHTYPTLPFCTKLNYSLCTYQQKIMI